MPTEPDIKKTIAHGMSSDSRLEQKEALKEALKEWLDEKFAQLGKWSLRTIAAVVFAIIVYYFIQTHRIP